MPAPLVSARSALERARYLERERLVTSLLLAVLLGGPLAVSFVVTAEALERGEVILSPPCTTKLVLGIECPSCGMSRAFAALSHGDPWQALDYNILSPAVYLLFWVLVVRSGYLAARAALRLRRWRAQPGDVAGMREV